MGAMAESRRSGCGCLLPGAILLIIVPALFAFVVVPARTGRAGLGGLTGVMVVFALVLFFVVLSAVRRHSGRPTIAAPEKQPREAGGPRRVAPSPISDDRPIPADKAVPPPPRRRSSSGTSSAPLDPETALLRERLAEAVADLSQEGTTEPIHRPITSEEMIARAKKRIREWTDD